MTTAEDIPYHQLTTLFLDVGNTLMSIDFSWVCDELREIGVECEPNVLQRAEAAARPGISEMVKDIQVKETAEVFKLYLANVFRHLPAGVFNHDDQLQESVAAITPILLPNGKTQRLWSHVLPDVREALAGFKSLNLRLVVVSNSDGTVEQSLEKAGLRSFFDEVVDSRVVGFEKPDPRIFEHALQISDAIPENTLHVGDIYAIDIVGARAAGIHALLVDPYDDWQNIDCERISNLLELSEKLRSAKND